MYTIDFFVSNRNFTTFKSCLKFQAFSFFVETFAQNYRVFSKFLKFQIFTGFLG